MGLFNAAANLFGQVYERATQVAATAVTAVADVARTLVGSTVDAVEQQVHEALTSVHDAVAAWSRRWRVRSARWPARSARSPATPSTP